MTDPRTVHPAADLLAAYAEGRLGDVREMESHLKTCAVCAEGVLIARQVAFAAESGAIPPLSDDERRKAKSRLAGLLKSRPLKADHSDPAAGSGSGPVTRASLGALAMFALGRGLSAAKPMLADHDTPEPPHASDTDEDSAAHPTDPSGTGPHADHHSEDSGHHHEIIPHESASSHMTHADHDDELSQFLDQSTSLLNDRPSHESSIPQSQTDETSLRSDDFPGDEDISAAPHHEGFDHGSHWDTQDDDASDDDADPSEAHDLAPPDDPHIDPATDAGHDHTTPDV